MSISNFSFRYICVICFVFIASLGQSPISEILILKLKILLVFQNKTNIESYRVLINAFWIRLRFVYRFVKYRLLDTHLDFLDTVILSKYFVCLKTCLEDVFKTCLQDAFRTCLQDVFSVTFFRLRRRFEDVLQTSSRRLGRQKIVTLWTCWRRLQDMSRRPTNVCWDVIYQTKLPYNR